MNNGIGQIIKTGKGATLVEKKDFRLFLQKELAMRCQRNPHYSLRSFSKVLKMDHSSLSQVLRGRRPISGNMQKKIGDALGLGNEEMGRFRVRPGTKERRRNPELAASPKTVSFEQLSEDQFSVLSDWYHDAILELTLTQDFKGDSKWIASHLGITVNEVNIATERMQRLGLLEITPSGKWIDKSGANCSPLYGTDKTNAASVKLQKQVLKKSIEALEEIPKPQRNHSSLIVAVEDKDLPEAKKMIREFMAELHDHFKHSQRKADSVYQVAVSMFPISKVNPLPRKSDKKYDKKNNRRTQNENN